MFRPKAPDGVWLRGERVGQGPLWTLGVLGHFEIVGLVPERVGIPLRGQVCAIKRSQIKLHWANPGTGT